MISKDRLSPNLKKEVEMSERKMIGLAYVKDQWRSILDVRDGKGKKKGYKEVCLPNGRWQIASTIKLREEKLS